MRFGFFIASKNGATLMIITGLKYQAFADNHTLYQKMVSE